MVQPRTSGSGGDRGQSGQPQRGGPPSAVNVLLVILAALVFIGVLTGGGREALTQIFAFLVFYGGVFTLVSLTLTVIAGLVATDRIMLVARHRVWVQSVHRTLGIVAISCLGLHISTEVLVGRVDLLGALIPFTTAPWTVGVGTLGAYLMVMVMWSGIVRSRFAHVGKAWMWRPLHASAYLSWPVALWHGLNAGRPPAVWVTASYLILFCLTMAALGVRLSAERNRRRQLTGSDRTTTEIAPIGRPEPASYDRRAERSPRRGRDRFRWDAPPADQQWDDRGAPQPAEYRRESIVDTAPVTAIPFEEPEFVSAAQVTAIPFEEPEFVTRRDEIHYDDEPRRTPERPRFSDEPAYDRDEPRYESDYDPYAEEYDAPEPYRGIAIPVYDDGPELDIQLERDEERQREDQRQRDEERQRDEFAGLSLRDRFTARRARAAEEAELAAEEAEHIAEEAERARAERAAEERAEEDRIEAARAEMAERERLYYDDTPTLVNLDTRRELRRQAREEREQSRRGRGPRYRDESIDEAEYWAQLRGEAR